MGVVEKRRVHRQQSRGDEGHPLARQGPPETRGQPHHRRREGEHGQLEELDPSDGPQHGEQSRKDRRVLGVKRGARQIEVAISLAGPKRFAEDQIARVVPTGEQGGFVQKQPQDRVEGCQRDGGPREPSPSTPFGGGRFPGVAHPELPTARRLRRRGLTIRATSAAPASTPPRRPAAVRSSRRESRARREAVRKPRGGRRA